MNDRDLRLFSSLTDVSDSLIEESILLPAARVTKTRRARAWFSELMSSPVAAAVLSAVVALTVLAAIVAAGRNSPGTTPVGSTGDQSFYIGMSYEDMVEELDSYLYRDPFLYGNWTFVSFHGGDRFLLITSGADSEGTYKVTDVRTYRAKSPTREDFAAVQTGMDIYALTALLGRPEGSYTSGASTLAYRTSEEDLYFIYLHGEGGTVSDVLWTNPDPLYASVTFPAEIGWTGLYYVTPEKVARLHEYCSNLYTTYVYDTLPGDSDGLECTVTITYEGGITKSYLFRGKLLSRNGGTSWSKIQEYQPHVTTTLEEIIHSMTSDPPNEINVFVLWVGEEGFWGYFPDIDAEVYVKIPHDFKVFDTVQVLYHPALLKPEEGTLGATGGADDQSFHYDFVLESPLSVKLSGPQMRG